MPRTLMQRLRIIAPLVVSTLYNVLWSDSGSGHFTQLCTHVCQESQFLAPLLNVEITSATSPVCFILSNRALSFLLLERRLALPRSSLEELKHIHSDVKPHSPCLALQLEELLLMTTGFVAEFSFYVPCAATNYVIY